MRRRTGVSPRSGNTEKWLGKNDPSRLCLLAILSVFFWLFLLYFHFIAIGGRNNNVLQQFNSVSLNNESTFSQINDPTPNVDENHSTGGVLSNPQSPPPPLVSTLSDPQAQPPPPPPPVSTLSNPESQPPPPPPLPPPVNTLSSPESQPPPPINTLSNPQSQPLPPVSTSRTPKVEDNSGGGVSSNSESPPPVSTKPKSETPKVDDHSDDGVSSNAQPPPSPIGNSKADDQSGNTSKNSQPSLDKSEDLIHEVKTYPFMKALRSIDNTSDPCGGRYIYVHDIPSKFKGDMLKECENLSPWINMCKFITNEGLGPPLEDTDGVFSDTGWYATNQFAVDVIFGNRMKQYECLTNDSSLAAAFFVPFYAGFDIARYLWGFNISMRDADSLDLISWLKNRPEWEIMGGKDHFLVAGRITWDFRRQSNEESDWGNNLFLLPAALNMSFLVVESSPWHANDYAIPYPTYFHPEKDADVFLWQERMMGLDRKWLYCFAGAPRPDDPKSIRDQIINECRKSQVCKLLECDMGESKCHSPGSIMKMFQSSLFCLQPQGDSFTRRSAFDSILAGCIPVFFHPGSAYVQYTWHLPKSFSNYSVLIPENDVRTNNVTIGEVLSKISPEKIKQMREEVINLIPKIIYADPRSKLETLKDAFDISVKGVIDKVTKLRRNMVEGRVENIIEELSWKYSLLEEGEELAPHIWDKFFEKQKDEAEESDAAKKSWKNEQNNYN